MARLDYYQIFSFAPDFEPGLKARKYVALIHYCILREFSPAYINNKKEQKTV